MTVDPTRTSKAQWLLSAAFIVGVALAGYVWKGSPKLAMNPVPAQVAQAPEPAASQAAEMPGGLDPEQFEALVGKLAERMRNEPDNAEGWAMLARSWMMLGKADDALAAFNKAQALAPQDADLMADHASLVAQREGMGAGSRAATLLDRTLAINPRQPKALLLAGVGAFAAKDFKRAVAHWELALEVMPDHPFAPQMKAGIVEARESLALGLGSNTNASPAAASGVAAGASGAAAAAAASAATGFVEGRVSLAPALAAKASPDDTVFVFARAAEGPRMPLAIVRKRVKDLPFDFRLDDTMAMSPQTKLSSVRHVVVGARVSQSGDAMPREGDLQGLSSAVAVGSKGLQIVIADEVAASAATR